MRGNFFSHYRLKKKQFETAVTYSSVYNGFFNVTNKNNRLYFIRSINDDDFTQTTIPPGVHEIESLNDEIKRIIIQEKLFPPKTYPFRIKPNCVILNSFIELSAERWIQVNLFKTIA